MADENRAKLEESMKGYKEKITTTTRAALPWNRDLVFTGTTPQGYEIEFDAQGQWGCKPTEALLLSLAGCLGIDIVNILQKMRIQLTGFRMELNGERNPTPPQFFKKIEIVLFLNGTGLDVRKIERAVSLSREKYCSVLNSLRQDLQLQVRQVLEDKAPSTQE